jgi:CCR4-NOT transcriptional regulation complex NOT5 subunit
LTENLGNEYEKHKLAVQQIEELLKRLRNAEIENEKLS